jgi:DNA-binding response OmpR family regulator
MLDFLLPRLSGWEVYKELQENEEWKNIPLIILSGRKEDVTAKISEPFDFLEKPFEKYQLQSAIKAAIIKSKSKLIIGNYKPTKLETDTQGNKQNNFSVASKDNKDKAVTFSNSEIQVKDETSERRFEKFRKHQQDDEA